MSTWALTQAESNELDAFHRRQLRSIIGVRYPDTISNNELYARTKTTPLSLEMFLARWKLFGHTLRMNNEVPAKQAMLDYFSIEKSGETSAFQGRPRTTPPIVLSQDLEQMKAAAAEARANATNKQRKTCLLYTSRRRRDGAKALVITVSTTSLKIAHMAIIRR